MDRERLIRRLDYLKTQLVDLAADENARINPSLTPVRIDFTLKPRSV